MSEEEFEQIDYEAALWVAREEAGLTDAEQDEYERWLQADPLHRERTAAHLETSAIMDLLREEKADEESTPETLPNERKALLAFWPMALAAAACLALATLFILPSLFRRESPEPAPFTQSILADTQQVAFLPDGSMIELKAGSSVRAFLDTNIRRIELLAGEAHFEVAKDQDRPFVVAVRETEIRAVGTAFNVRLSDSEIDVLITEGIVEVTQPALNTVPSSETRNKRLLPKQRILIPTEVASLPNEIQTVEAAEVAQLLSWKNDRFQFDGKPLRDVVDFFNRRNQINIVLADKSMESILVDGAFSSGNVDGFIRALELTHDLYADRSNLPTITLRSN